MTKTWLDNTYSSEWMKHVKRYAKEHNISSLKLALESAAPTYCMHIKRRKLCTAHNEINECAMYPAECVWVRRRDRVQRTQTHEWRCQKTWLISQKNILKKTTLDQKKFHQKTFYQKTFHQKTFHHKKFYQKKFHQKTFHHKKFSQKKNKNGQENKFRFHKTVTWNISVTKLTSLSRFCLLRKDEERERWASLFFETDAKWLMQMGQTLSCGSFILINLFLNFIFRNRCQMAHAP